MGVLATAWQARFPAQVQVALTNPEQDGTTTVNTVVLLAAEADAGADFLLRTGIAFDPTVATHLAVGIKGLTFFLHSYRSLPRSPVLTASEEEWKMGCSAVARVLGALTWQIPQTNSNLVPSPEPAARPDFDRENWDLIPPPPRGGDWTSPGGCDR